MILFKCDHRGCKVTAKSGGVWYDDRSGREIIENLGKFLLMSDGKVYCPKHATEERQIERYDMDPARKACAVKPCCHKALPEVIFCRHHHELFDIWRGKNRMARVDDFCELHGGMRDP